MKKTKIFLLVILLAIFYSCSPSSANTFAESGTIVGKMIPYIIILLILIWIVKKIFGGKK